MSSEKLNNTNSDTEVQGRVSAVGMSKTSKNLMVLGIVAMTIIALFYIFSSVSDPEQSNAKKDQKDVQRALDVSRPVVVEKDPVIGLPIKLPDLPDLVAPPEPPPSFKQEVKKPSLPDLIPFLQRNKNGNELGKSNVTTPVSIERKRPAVVQDRNTPMLVISASSESGGSGGVSISDPSSIVSADSLGKIRDSFKRKEEVVDESAPLKRTDADQVKVTYIGDRQVMIAQGKIIDVVLETAINTDLNGMLRAVVSRDVYSEAGNNVLLPKGSRLIGSYNSSIGASQVRVDVIWKRVIRPDGIDLQLESPGTDQLGRGGVGGAVDTKFGHLFMNSVLISSIKVAGGVVIKKLFGDQILKKETIGDKLTETSSPVATLSTDAVNKLAEVFETVINQYSSSQPTIRVNQGTLIKVFVNKDLIFSRNLNNNADMIN